MLRTKIFGTDIVSPFVVPSGNSIYSNQYATTFVSGIGSTKTIDWNVGLAQHLNFNGVASGTYSLNLSNGIPGSAYMLTTQQNASGTITLAWGPTRILWQGGTSGIITAASGRIDMFSFYYNGANYLGSFSNNYL